MTKRRTLDEYMEIAEETKEVFEGITSNVYAGVCPNCNDTGWKQMRDIAVRCYACCEHSMGYWKLDKQLHNATEERYAACTNGCGHTINRVEYESLEGYRGKIVSHTDSSGNEIGRDVLYKGREFVMPKQAQGEDND